MYKLNRSLSVSFFSNINSRILISLAVVSVVTILSATSALALPDLSPWQNPAGENMGVGPDITVCEQPVVGIPCEVSVAVFNYGDMAVTSTVAEPIEVQFFTLPAAIVNETIALPEGTTIDPNSFYTVTFDWIPVISQTQFSVRLNPNSTILESFFLNNETTLDIMVEEPFVDLTPWLNAAGANNNGNPPPYDIETCADPTAGMPCDVKITVTNLGNIPITSTLNDPIEVNMNSPQGGFDTTQSFPDGTTINPGGSAMIIFEWIPHADQSELTAIVDPFDLIIESDEANNVTTRTVSVFIPRNVPTLSEWSMIGMAAGLLIFSVFYARRKNYIA